MKEKIIKSLILVLSLILILVLVNFIKIKINNYLDSRQKKEANIEFEDPNIILISVEEFSKTLTDKKESEDLLLETENYSESLDKKQDPSEILQKIEINNI